MCLYFIIFFTMSNLLSTKVLFYNYLPLYTQQLARTVLKLLWLVTWKEQQLHQTSKHKVNISMFSFIYLSYMTLKFEPILLVFKNLLIWCWLNKKMCRIKLTAKWSLSRRRPMVVTIDLWSNTTSWGPILPSSGGNASTAKYTNYNTHAYQSWCYE